MAHTMPRFIHHPHSPLSVLLPPPPTTPSLFSNHHTTRPLCSSTAHSSASHTHGVDGMCLCGCSHVLCVVCVDGMHIPSHCPHTHTATTTVALPIATPPLFGVCVHGNTCHMAMQYTTVLVCPTLDATVHTTITAFHVCGCVAKWCLSIAFIPSLPLSTVPHCSSSTHHMHTTLVSLLCFHPLLSSQVLAFWELSHSIHLLITAIHLVGCALLCAFHPLPS